MTPTSAAALRDVLPAGSERASASYVIDGATPQLAHRPRTREEVARLLSSAAEAGLVVVPQGGRTALTLGRPLDRYDVALDLHGLDRVVAYEPEDLTVTVEAGLTLAALQALLARQGQYLPADPPPDDRVTIGGLLATARPGAWRGHLPAARDLVLGVTVAQPDGTLIRSGGRVVKNVSGYDLHRLQTGALGAFGVIVEASFKLAPQPAAIRTFAIRCADLEAAARAAFAAREAALPTRALSLLSPAAAAHAGLPEAAHVLVECAGDEATLARCARAFASAAREAGARAEDDGAMAWPRLRALAGDESAVVLRLGVPTSAVAESITAATNLGAVAWGHVAAGSVLAHAPSVAAADIVTLREHAVARGGFLQLEAGPPALRRAVDPSGAGERQLVRALRAQFDPRSTINRGRWEAGP